MFISATNIRQLIDSPNPIISPCDRSFIEGNFYDLRLDEVFVTRDESYSSFIGLNKRSLPEIEPLQTIDPKHITKRLEATAGVYKLYEGFYLCRTIETITPPRWLMAELCERTSIFRAGAIVRATRVPAGYSGQITSALHVPTGCSLTLEKGARFLSVAFALSITLKLDDNFEPVIPLEMNLDGGDSYAGVWGGSRVTTNGELDRAY
jgi:deoxycytidine triphosphate deaminase